MWLREFGKFVALPIPAEFVTYFEELCGVNASVPGGATVGTAPATVTDPEDIERAAKLAELLSPARAEAYASWIDVGICLHNIDQGLLGVWCEFSQKSSKYDESVCEEKWAGFTDGPLGFGSLVVWAKKDDPEGYSAWVASERESPAVSDDDSMATARTLMEGLGQDPGILVSVRNAYVESNKLTLVAECMDMDQTLQLDLASPRVTSTVNGSVLSQNYMHAVHAIDTMGAYDLATIHKDIKTGLPWWLRRPDDNHVVFSTQDQLTHIDLLNMDAPGGQVANVRQEGHRAARVTTKKDMAVLQSMVSSSVKHALVNRYGMGCWINGDNNTVNTVNNVNVYTGDAENGDFDLIRIKLLNHAKERRYRKANGNVYAPVEGCPCGYMVLCQYDKYINVALKNDTVYLSNPLRFKQMKSFLQEYDVDEMPAYEPEWELLSFGNGVLLLDSNTFAPYASAGPELTSRVARYHIANEYMGHVDTPLLDGVLSAQFDPDVAELLCALLGRLLFPVGKVDNWQVMPYLVGVGGTGKSVILSIVGGMVGPGKVGNLSSKREEIFGMANLLDKEIVIGRDMPAKLSGTLSQELMQVMVTGEEIEVPRKGLPALQIKWVAPVVMASNHMPDYQNMGGNVGRRLATICFNNPVDRPQGGLLAGIMAHELPNIVCRFVRAYHALCERAAGDFWNSVPGVMLDWQNDMAASTNKLHAFLGMDEDERGCRISRVEGAVTWVHDFKAAYKDKMAGCKFESDPATFHQFGYRLSAKEENVCKSCRKLAKVGCCAMYGGSNRIKKKVIYNMELRLNERDTSSPKELEFKTALEAHTGMHFEKQRPEWLRNPITGHCMELDMVNMMCKVAVEYDGAQHTEYPNAYHKTREQFDQQQQRDKDKGELCKKHGYTLIRVRACMSVVDELQKYDVEIRSTAAHH